MVRLLVEVTQVEFIESNESVFEKPFVHQFDLHLGILELRCFKVFRLEK